MVWTLKNSSFDLCLHSITTSYSLSLCVYITTYIQAKVEDMRKDEGKRKTFHQPSSAYFSSCTLLRIHETRNRNKNFHNSFRYNGKRTKQSLIVTVSLTVSQSTQIEMFFFSSCYLLLFGLWFNLGVCVCLYVLVGGKLQTNNSKYIKINFFYFDNNFKQQIFMSVLGKVSSELFFIFIFIQPVYSLSLSHWWQCWYLWL